MDSIEYAKVKNQEIHQEVDCRTAKMMLRRADTREMKCWLGS